MKINIRIILTFTFLHFASVTHGQTELDYDKLWKQVEIFEIKDLPKSANQLVDSIYRKAKIDENLDQKLKALIYQSKFSMLLEEDSEVKIFKRFEEEISQFEGYQKNILQSVFGNLLQEYYSRNRWQFLNRMQTLDAVNPNDFRTWDAVTLMDYIKKLHLASIYQVDLLKIIPISSIDFFVNIYKDETSIASYFDPSLYDLLVQNALEFFKNNDHPENISINNFNINSREYFFNYKFFENETDLQNSFEFSALKIYEEIIDVYIKSDDKTASAYWLSERLDFVKNNSTDFERETNYKEALIRLIDTYQNLDIAAFFHYKLAYYYYNFVRDNDGKDDKTLKNNRKLSIDQCHLAIKKYPESIGAKFSAELKANIETPYSVYEMDGVIPSQTPSRVFITYKNLDSLDFKVYKVDTASKAELRKAFEHEDRYQLIKKLELEKSWSSNLVNQKDHNLYIMETMIPALDYGSYLLVSQHPENRQIHGYSFFDVSDLSYVNMQFGERYVFKILNRSSGIPVQNAELEFFSNIKSKPFFLHQKYFSDSKGTVSFSSKESGYNLSLDVKHGIDSIRFQNFNLYKNYNALDEQEINVQAFIFTDRKIYRPGQKLFFKGVLVKEEKGISEVVAGESVIVSFSDPNGQNRGELKIITNKYGSFSGEFDIPSSGLTGMYEVTVEEDDEVDSKFFDHLDVYFDYSSISVSVEEYKRPRFEVSLPEIKESFKVNDSIKIRGEAIAYSGNSISSGVVSYRVFRTTQMSPFYFKKSGSRYFPSGSRQEIVSGKTKTDQNGKFELDFQAIPDYKIDKKDLPVFQYQVEVEVTDINGETRSQDKSVVVAYHIMNLDATIPAEIFKSKSPEKIVVSAKNLNQENVGAKGKITILKKSFSDRVTLPLGESRIPDFPRWSKSEFHQLFPQEAYPFDELIPTDNNAKKVTEIDFDTSKSKEISMPNILDWEHGSYVMQIVVFDSLGFEIKDEKEFEIIDQSSKSVSDNKLFQIFTDKKSYQINDKVLLKAGTAAKDLYVTINVEKKGDIYSEHVISLSEEVKEIIIPVSKDDQEGFAIHYYYVYGNKVFSGVISVQVESLLKPVKIVTETFRNKLVPGSNETWSFRIVGDGKEKLAFEVLAGMYDISLDQLTYFPNRWNLNQNTRPIFYPRLGISDNNSFRSANNINLIGTSTLYAAQSKFQSLPNFDRFGLSLVRNSSAQRTYLYSLKTRFLESKIEQSFDPRIPNGYIRGLVTDIYGDPLESASIAVSNTNTSVKTNAKGEFYIKAESKSEILIEYPFLKSERFWVGKENVIHVMLAEEIKELDQITVTGYGAQEMRTVAIRGTSSVSEPVYELAEAPPMFEGNVMGMGDVDYNVPPPSFIDQSAAQYEKNNAQQTKFRSDFRETAFFYPHLETNKNGEFVFSFDAPESLTAWKLMLFSHNKKLQTAYSEAKVVTQKELMITPNFPRFLREGDSMVLSAKISNLSSKSQKGNATLSFENELTSEVLNIIIDQSDLGFDIKPFESININWKVQVPEGQGLLNYKISAITEDYSDGEQSILPVLSKRILVTESMPVWANPGDKKAFSFEKLENINSSTLENHLLTFELTANPLWYVLESIPYINELSNENSEQLLSRIFVNSLGLDLINKYPELRAILELWAKDGIPEDRLAKNPELKSILLNETPWLKDLENEDAKMKKLAALLNREKLQTSIDDDIQKLKIHQHADGGFVWYKGSTTSNHHMTVHILESIGKLKQMGIGIKSDVWGDMIDRGLKYLENDLLKTYTSIQDNATSMTQDEAARYLKQSHLNQKVIDVLYVNVLNEKLKYSDKYIKAFAYYISQIESHWVSLSLDNRAKVVWVMDAYNKKIYKPILKSIWENSVNSEELGNYWKLNDSKSSWGNSAIETHSEMLGLFMKFGEEIFDKEQNEKFVNDMMKWLLKQKQTNHWSTSKSTMSAITTIYKNTKSWSGNDFKGIVNVGNEVLLDSKSDISSLSEGYLKKSWDKQSIEPELANVTLDNQGETILWGSMYWQYFEDIDNISESDGGIVISKGLFVRINSPTGFKFEQIQKDKVINVGDLIKVRIELKLDRDIDFVHISDQRASGLDPIQVISGYKYQNGVGYYESHKDATTHFFFDSLKKGVYVFEYDLRAGQAGDFASGITKIESVYAPEFNSHTSGQRLKIK